MTSATLVLPEAWQHTAAPANPFVAWLQRYRRDLAVVIPLLIAVGVAHALNMGGWPGRVNDDEGTYVAQAWAVVKEGSLTHYTYTYDHPPLGWLMIAAYAWLTDGFARDSTTVMVGREAMLVTNIVCCGLLYLLARRLGMRQLFAVLTVAVFAFSPLSMQYHRMVFLDNMSTTLVVASLVFAASPKKSLAASTGAGLCLAAAMLTKETAAVALPVVCWMLYQRTDKRMRGWNFALLLGLTGLVTLLYPLYSLLKGELLPGSGHVSLLGSLVWQLFSRPGSGSVLDKSSGTYGLVHSWLQLDSWLLVSGTLLIPVGFLVKRYRPIALGIFIGVALLCRSGYTPYPYVIALLPFAALLSGGILDSAWSRRQTATRPLGLRGLISFLPRSAVVASVLVFAVAATPHWTSMLRTAWSANLGAPYQAATQWTYQHIGRNQTIIVDDYVWPDLALQGYRRQIWAYKVDLDPAVKEKLLPDGYRDVDYVILGRFASQTLAQLPTVAAAVRHSKIVASFGDGDITVRRVVRPAAG